MFFMSTMKGGADAVSQLLGRQGAIWFKDPTLAMQPLGFNRVQPRTFDGQRTDQDAHTLAGGLDLPVMLSDPSAHSLANMPRGIVPDQGQDPLAQGGYFGAAPRQKLGRDSTDRPTVNEAQPHLLLGLILSQVPADQQTITSQCFTIRIIFGWLQLDQTI